MQISRLLRRLRSDFQLSIITLMGLFGVIGISPYAVYRLATGNYLVGVATAIAANPSATGRVRLNGSLGHLVTA